MPTKPTCSVDGCKRAYYNNGHCTHHRRIYRGVPSAVGAMSRTVLQRFFDKVEVTEGCWLWLGATSKGYGYFVTRNPKSVGAHRWLYEQLVGAVSGGLVLDHLCDTPRCVNPDHLQPTTHRANILRGSSPPAKNSRKTHCINGHPFTPDNTIPQSSGSGRQCRACTRSRKPFIIRELEGA